MEWDWDFLSHWKGSTNTGSGLTPAGDVSQVLPFMGRGSIESEWMMFVTERPHFPQPWMSASLCYANLDRANPPGGPVGLRDQMLSLWDFAFEGDLVVQTEKITEHCSLGAMWSAMKPMSTPIVLSTRNPMFKNFLSPMNTAVTMDTWSTMNPLSAMNPSTNALPTRNPSSSEDMEIPLNKKVWGKKFRYMEFSRDGVGELLLTFSISENYLAFRHACEIDERRSGMVDGLIDRRTGHCVIVGGVQGFRSCVGCYEATKICRCESEELNKQWKEAYFERRQMLEHNCTTASLGTSYIQSLCHARWGLVSTPIIEKPPTSASPATIYFLHFNTDRGSKLETAVNSILEQQRVEILTPQVSSRFLQMMLQHIRAEGGNSNRREMTREMEPSILENSEFHEPQSLNPVRERGESSDARRELRPQVPRERTDLMSQWNAPLGQIDEQIASNEVPEILPTMKMENAATKKMDMVSAEKEIEPAEKAEYECDHCGYVFKKRSDRTRHLRTVHERRRDFRCNLCGKQFLQSGHLREHMNVLHHGLRDFACDQCDKVFGAKSKLVRHKRSVHENLRPYTCEICNKDFKDRSYLKHHLGLVHRSPDRKDGDS